jgi:hypothetical protein
MLGREILRIVYCRKEGRREEKLTSNILIVNGKIATSLLDLEMNWRILVKLTYGNRVEGFEMKFII